MKLDELLGKDYVPGSMKVRFRGGSTAYFIPYFRDSGGKWFGVNHHGAGVWYFGGSTEWEEYKEPLYTISELVEQQSDFIPGKLKLVSQGDVISQSDVIFYPYFLDRDGDWVGHNDNNELKPKDSDTRKWRVAND